MPCRIMILSLMFSALAFGQSADELPEEVFVWQGIAPGAEGKSGDKVVRPGADRVVNNVHRPSVFPYLPAAGKSNGAAVVIAPGGGHNSLWTTHEGHHPAKYFAERGIAAFVLEYRLAEEADSTYTVDDHALADLQRTIRLVRSRAEEWRIDPRRVGAMGFSAGGELVALSGMRFDAGQPDADDVVQRESCRPDFLALIYPGRSRRFEPIPETPQTFILAGFGDRPDISEGMAQVYLKFKNAGVPTELHIYSNAGHGFGLRDGRSGAVMKWPDRFIDWLQDRELLADTD